MTDDWKVIYNALYETGKKTKSDLKKVKKTRLTDAERIAVCGE